MKLRYNGATYCQSPTGAVRTGRRLSRSSKEKKSSGWMGCAASSGLLGGISSNDEHIDDHVGPKGHWRFCEWVRKIRALLVETVF